MNDRFLLVFDLDADTNVAVRVLSLFAARGLAVAAVSFATNRCGGARMSVTTDGEADGLRILAAKAASLVGVREAFCRHELRQREHAA